MAFHDQASVSGITEACKYNDHSVCNNPSCSCDCHKLAKAEVEAGETIENGKPEKACPTCGVKRPFRETFCRVDGARLTSLMCALCGSGGEGGDKYCWKCGAPLGADQPPSPTGGTSLQVPEEDPEVDYARQVLGGIQKELGSQEVGEVGEVGGENGNRKVVETPMGEGGSFKLVNAPSPVKIRVPIPAGGPPSGGTRPEGVAARPRPGFRLPVKPS